MFIQGQTHLGSAKASARNILIFDFKDSASERTSEDTKVNLVPEPVYLNESMHCSPQPIIESRKCGRVGQIIQKIVTIAPITIWIQ